MRGRSRFLEHVDKLKMVDGDVPRSWLDAQTTSDESEEETLEDLFDDEQPPSIEEEPTRPKRARKLPERFKDFVCQVQPGTGIQGGRRSQEPSERAAPWIDGRQVGVWRDARGVARDGRLR